MSGRALLTVIAGLLMIPLLAYVGAKRKIEATERSAEKAAFAQTNRKIDVRCPGPIMERFDASLLEGRVDFDADGVPKPYTNLSSKTCIGLRVLHQRRTRLDFNCLQTGGCQNDEDKAALGVAVLTHEIMHLRGVTDEAVTECLARKRLPDVARVLGLNEQEIAGIARYQVQVLGPMLSSRYQGGQC
jgi:hypothetical protein